MMYSRKIDKEKEMEQGREDDESTMDNNDDGGGGYASELPSNIHRKANIILRSRTASSVEKAPDDDDNGGGGVEFGSDQINYLANKILMSIPAETLTQEEKALTLNLLKLKPIGLNIGNASALQELLKKHLNRGESSQNSKANQSTKQRVDHSTFLKNAQNIRAANFVAKLVKIGLWQIESKIEGDLVAKWYYAKKKLAWEYLDKSIKLKKKIEIQWSDISAIRAIIHEDDYGILDIELNNPPTFQDEDDPQPRKHTCWKLTRDFTNGQGSIHRRHRLVFLPGSLDKHYEKLLSLDERLFELSQKPFPSSKSPYFSSNSLRQSSLFENNNSYRVEMKHSSQFPLLYESLPVLAPLQTPTYRQQTFQPFSASKETATSPVSVIEYRQMDDSGTRFANNPLTTYFDPQGMRSYGNNLPRNQAQALMYQANNHPVAYHQSFNIPTPNSQSELLALISLEDHLLNDSIVMENDQSNFPPEVDPLNALSHEHVVPEQSETSNFDWRVLRHPTRSSDHSVAYHQNINIPTLNSQSELLALRSLEDHLLNDSLVIDNDESDFPPEVDTLNALSHEHVVPEQSELSNFDEDFSSVNTENERIGCISLNQRH